MEKEMSLKKRFLKMSEGIGLSKDTIKTISTELEIEDEEEDNKKEENNKKEEKKSNNDEEEKSNKDEEEKSNKDEEKNTNKSKKEDEEEPKETSLVQDALQAMRDQNKAMTFKTI